MLDVLDGNIPVTVQTMDIGNLSSRFVSTTSSFKLPPTENNAIFFGFAQMLQSNDETMYTSIQVTLIDDGVELFKGFLLIQRIEKNIEVQVLSREIGFFKAIENLSLRDIDFGDSPITFDAAYIDSRRSSTSGIVCPVIQYGQIDETGSAIGDYYLPSVSLDTIIQAIAENAGYSISGELMNTDHYSTAIMAYSYNGWPGINFTINQILPDMQQTELIKWLLIAFGAITVESGNEIVLYRYEDILSNNVRSLDWTSKRAKDRPDKIEFVYGNYARKNTVSAMTPYSGDSFTSGSLDIDNELLKPDNEIYDSPILIADDTIQVNNNADFIYCAALYWWQEGNLPTGYPPVTPFDNEPNPVILLTRERYTDEPDVEYNGIARNDYRVAYGDYLQISTNVINPLSTQWSSVGRVGFFDIHYPNFQRCLNRLKVVTRYYNLSVTDIYEADLSKLIFDTDTYYMVTKIENFINGRITKVQLLTRTIGEIPENQQTNSVSPGTAELTINGFSPNITVVT